MNAPIETALRSPTQERRAGENRPFSLLSPEDGFGRLGEAFYTRLDAMPLPEPYLVAASAPAARLIGVDPTSLAAPESVAVLAGNARLPGSQPLASVYAGHQFGVWAGRLGDGRALLLGDVPAAARGDLRALGGSDQALLDFDRWELQLKGSGKTPYSRMGDGRAVLRSSIREFLCSEAMAALGIPTTRALAVVGSDTPVIREDVETAAVVTRMSPTFVRFGHFEYFYYARRHDDLRRLADYVIDRFYAPLAGREDRYAAFLSEVAGRTARTIAKWQAVGFCHGVMNTDNMSILGLTIDYGPFGFLDAFDAGHICNHSDEGGRYAYGRQPGIGEWNCYALGQALVPLIGSPEATEAALASYRPAFKEEFERQLRLKLGLAQALPEDTALFEALFDMLQATRADFTLFFRELGGVLAAGPERDALVRDLCIDPVACDQWVARYRSRLQAEAIGDGARREAMNRVNPRFVLRNYLAEEAIRQATAATADPPAERRFSATDSLAKVLARPFDDQPENARYAAPPPDWASAISVSCSS
jgi:uncharacterized protein YdiU (UPF0061 family)